MSWTQTPIYYGLDVIDVGILLVCGLAASGLCYIATERVKARVPRQYRALLPFLFSALITAICLPMVLDGLGEHGIEGRRMLGAVMVCSAAGGLVAKAAHDYLVDILGAAKARLLSLIGGGQ